MLPLIYFNFNFNVNSQANPECVALERDGLKLRTSPPLATTYAPIETPAAWRELSSRPRVAILREEGSNGDREMAAAFTHAGFEAWDVCVGDLAAEGSTVALDAFRGVVFVGGFSYADVLDSAKGWAGGLRFNPTLRAQFDAFYKRDDSFSLGVCNGCQLMALLGW